MVKWGLIMLIFGVCHICSVGVLFSSPFFAHKHTHFDETTFAQDNANGCTYRHKLPVPFRGGLVSKRQGRGSQGDTKTQRGRAIDKSRVTGSNMMKSDCPLLLWRWI